MDPLNFIGALDLNERCVAIQRAIEDDRLEPRFVELAWFQWIERKKSLTNDQMSSVMSMRKFSREIISMASDPNPDSEVKTVLAEAVEGSHWFKDIYLDMQNHNFDEAAEVGYALLYAPFISRLVESVTPYINASNIFTERILESFIINLASSLHRLCVRCVIHALQVHGVVDGSNDETGERLVDFLSTYAQRQNLETFYSEYPNLARCMSETTSRHIDFTLEMCRNLTDVSSQIGLSRTCRISNITIGEGDTHRGGRTVARVQTETDDVMYYKPHVLKSEKLFHQVVEHLNNYSDLLPLSLPKIWWFNGFSISREVSYLPCESHTQVQRAYRRFGELLGISYIFQFTDLHMENLVISGEHPIIVDAETFIANRLSFDTSGFSKASAEVLKQAARFVTSSILLPSKIYLDASLRSVDLGAISAGEQNVDGVLVLKDVDNVNVRFERSSGVVPAAKNQIRHGDSVTDYRKYTDEVLLGFTSALDCISHCADELVKIVQGFSDAESRVLIRATSSYARLLDFSLHPSCMQDRRESDKIFENLFAMPGISPEIYLAEYYDMSHGDVPYFTTPINSTDIIDSLGNRIDNAFEESAQRIVVHHLRTGVDALSVNAQKTLIRAKIGSVDEATSADSLDSDFHGFSRSKNHEQSLAMFKDTISKIADAGVRCSVQSNIDNSVSWLSLDEDHDFIPVPLQSDVYSGMAGVGLFYLQLGDVLGRADYLQMAERIRDTLLLPLPSMSPGLSAFVGPTSSVPFALKLYALNQNRTNRKFMIDGMTSIRSVVESGKFDDFSWLTGVSSLLPLLIDCYEITGDDIWLGPTHALADQLAESITKISFNDAGVAHGQLGLALSLMRYGTEMDSPRHTDVAKSVLKVVGEHPWGLEGIRSYCRGIAGFLHVVSDAVQSGVLDKEELILAADATGFFNYDLMRSDCLCHGNCGTIDAAISAYQASGEERFIEYAWDLARAMVDRANMAGAFAVETRPGFPNVGLFKSLTGIGYTLLRLTNAHIPSILVLSKGGE
ncbi:type 2 lanthipeptide synthetase LanM [Arcanobacterium pinnipediorum]|uniref:Type 2 lanthipeptide synthetase LanM n=1 Tax=Arcanobacterium pinnipediorum TaxID=1503041 RepID=A0ABY5AIT0_9ACTO|nr:type 2 lanthipeptide synthetase LanM [Arcanobacterium pinnipediorum]USR79843.1 type 2 lanthipeptide synthetase LanM [Arcanobacterium pinnipediorum]